MYGLLNLYFAEVCLSILGTWAGPSWTSLTTFRTVLLLVCSCLHVYPNIFRTMDLDGISCYTTCGCISLKEVEPRLPRFFFKRSGVSNQCCLLSQGWLDPLPSVHCFTLRLSIQSLLCANPLQNEPGHEHETGSDCELYAAAQPDSIGFGDF